MPFVIVADDDEHGEQPFTDERGKPKIYKTREAAEKDLPIVTERHLRYVPAAMRDRMPVPRVAEVQGDTKPGGHWYFG